jgi:hypothetical protein
MQKAKQGLESIPVKQNPFIKAKMIEGEIQEMKTMPQIESIREMYAEGKSIRSISRTAGIDFATAKKYIGQHDFSERLPSEGKGKSVLNQYMHEINSMLEESRRNWYKPRYTA